MPEALSGEERRLFIERTLPAMKILDMLNRRKYLGEFFDWKWRRLYDVIGRGKYRLQLFSKKGGHLVLILGCNNYGDTRRIARSRGTTLDEVVDRMTYQLLNHKPTPP